MSVYAVDKLIVQARKLASDYRKAMGKPLAGISVEIAEYDAVNLLGLALCEPRVAGYDAIGQGAREGKRIQIKGRVLSDSKSTGQRIGQLQLDQDWDSVVLVILDEDYQPHAIYEADRQAILDAMQDDEQGEGKKRNRRGAMSVARFKKIARLAWQNASADDSRASG